MADFGFKISTFALSSLRAPIQHFPLDYPVLGVGGAKGLFLDVIEKVFAGGGKKGRKGDYLELVSIGSLEHGILLTVKGGGTGDEYEIIDTATGDQGGKVNLDDALTWTSRILMIFPPDHYDGMLIAETHGNKHHATSLFNAIDPPIRTENSCRLTVTHDVADAVGWQRVLTPETAHVQTIEFKRTPNANDGTQFPEDADVKKVKIEYTVAKDSTLERKIIKVLTSEAPDKHGLLQQLVGGRRYADTSFDDEIATVVSNGRPRKYRISNRQTWFNYHIDSGIKLEDGDFIKEVTPAVMDTYSQLSIALPAGWSTPVE
ncbi:hypothetical protein MB46_10260 [Arthrobacter alpinus]|uniref:hypothetical protein n=1 Tax=Arthrobacter alpinus TaxID=656366 RepID=UPI0005C925EF|nr:hypothetical protein [Arthrobacter alpinus]ALV45804.1 hypothetical protein MB46_10260 [Arthrobacter alpinus]